MLQIKDKRCIKFVIEEQSIRSKQPRKDPEADCSVSIELNGWLLDAKLKRSNGKMFCVTGIEKYLRQDGESVRFMFSRGGLLK